MKSTMNTHSKLECKGIAALPWFFLPSPSGVDGREGSSRFSRSEATVNVDVGDAFAPAEAAGRRRRLGAIICVVFAGRSNGG